MDLHNVGSADRSRAAYEHVEPLAWEVYGRPSAAPLRPCDMLQPLHQASPSHSIPNTSPASFVLCRPDTQGSGPGPLSGPLSILSLVSHASLGCTQ